MMKILVYALFLLTTTSSFAWNGAGHRTIGYIAYQHLTPNTRKAINPITASLFHSRYPDSRLMHASSWPDQLRAKGITQYNEWHFINIPLIHDHITPLPLHHDNLVWAINQCRTKLQDHSLSTQQKAWYLSFLIHLIGDASQPLHCTTLYSKQFPSGDQGGNLFMVKSRNADNLHKLWDRGFGLFMTRKHYMNYWQIKKIANSIMQHYPESQFQKRLADQNTQDWAHNSYLLGTRDAYNIQFNTKPSRNYIKLGKFIVMQQVALAGYRVAAILNQLFSNTGSQHD